MNIMISGLPGKVASLVAQAIQEHDTLQLHPYGLKGTNTSEKTWQNIDLLDPSQRNTTDFGKPEIVVDYTNPLAIHENASFYCQRDIPFVMGTSGGNRELLEKQIKEQEGIAVLAQNMSPEIVVLQSMLQYAAEQFPDSFKGLSLHVLESHQKSKVDVSGTAKAMLPYFQQLGICCDEHCIVPVRNIEKQRALGVPETALEGHAWHTYSISNPSTTIEITHNLIGRASYVKGTICAVEFLQRYITSDYVQKGSVFSMLDVLKNQTN